MLANQVGVATGAVRPPETNGLRGHWSGGQGEGSQRLRAGPLGRDSVARAKAGGAGNNQRDRHTLVTCGGWLVLVWFRERAGVCVPYVLLVFAGMYVQRA